MILLKKALRAMWNNKKTYMACAILISVGAFIYVAMGISAFALEDSMHRYYRDYRMADVFSRVARAPVSAMDDLLAIDGISAVDARLTYDARAEVYGADQIITLRLMSFTDCDERLNKFHITYGEFPSGENDIVLGHNFFMAHGLEPGAQIEVIIRGRAHSFNIAAAALSPEFVYAIPDASNMFPDDMAFGYAYVSYESLAAMLDMRGMANDISFLLSPGTEFDDIRAELEDALERYGLISLIPRDDQLSHAILEMEIHSLQSMSQSLSIMFVACSMVMLYLMLKRLVEQDRAQIGTLKAFGFKNIEILLHYLTYGVVIGILGGFIGALAGFLSADALIYTLGEFFKMPEMSTYQSADIVIQALIIAVAGGVLGSFMGAYGVINLHPAAAMRPAPPKPVKYDILSMLPFIKIFLNSRGFMALRSIDRNRVRSAFIIVGVMFSFSIIALMNSMAGMVDTLIYDQFEKVRMYDVRVSFTRPIPITGAVWSIYAAPGVTKAEAVFETPVMLINKHIREGALITGMNPDSELIRIFDINRNAHVTLCNRGIILSYALAQDLAVQPGDRIYVSSPLLVYDRAIYVADIVKEIIGGGNYMSIEALTDLLDISPLASSVVFNTDDLPYIMRHLRDAEFISSIDDVRGSQAAMAELMGSYDVLLSTMWLMGVLVALVIIYNTSSISLNERKREYATLRVLGLNVSEVAEIMSFEYWALAAVGMILGIPFTGVLRAGLINMIDVDFFNMSPHTELQAFMIAFIGCWAAVVISNTIAKRAIKKFDIVEVLKERE